MSLGSPAAGQPFDRYGRSARAVRGMVSAARPEAAQAGVAMLQAGGNAVDAAVACGFALGVVEPAASGIGGGGFMILRLAHLPEAVVVDFRETAPAAARPDLYRHGADGKVLGLASSVGGLAAGVPGEVAGLLYALEHFGSGRLTRAQVMAPAIAWARAGYPVTRFLSELLHECAHLIRRSPPCAALYLRDGQPLPLGSAVRNPDLGAVLERIAEQGADAFYRGGLARRIAEGVRADGGILTAEDLAGYQVKVRRPVAGSYRGHTILSVPPASSGGAHLVQLLNILENFDLRASGWGSAGSLHLWAEALKLVFADRAAYMADSDFVPVPLAGLCAKSYARDLAGRIHPERLMPPPGPGDPFPHESSSTTSYAVMDGAGGMVACTKSLNDFFAGTMVPGLGFIMNAHMDDFVTLPGSVNSVQPGKRPLSSMSPALVLDPHGRPLLTVGSPGASRIFPTVAQVISNVVDFAMPLQEAIDAPRLFQADRGGLDVEGRVALSAYQGLAALGHAVLVHPDFDYFFGGVHAVLGDPESGILTGGADPRRDGQAFGL